MRSEGVSEKEGGLEGHMEKMCSGARLEVQEHGIQYLRKKMN